MLRSEDLVEVKGIECVVTNLYPDGTCLCQPLGRGLPTRIKQEEVKVIKSFLSELEKLQTCEELQALLLANEDMLEKMSSEKKAKKSKKVRTGTPVENLEELDGGLEI